MTSGGFESLIRFPESLLLIHTIFRYSFLDQICVDDDTLKIWGALHSGDASERFATLCSATVSFKKAPRSAPRHSLELSLGERFFATYRCIEN